MIDQRLLAVPIDAIENIAEFQLTEPPPMAPDYVAGLGARGDRVFTTVSLRRRPLPTRQGEHSAQCLLIKRDSQKFQWSLEVDSIESMTTVSETAGADSIAREWSRFTQWIRFGRNANGMDVPILDWERLTLDMARLETTAGAAA